MKKLVLTAVLVATAGLFLAGCTRTADPDLTLAGDMSGIDQEIASLQAAAKPIVNAGAPSGLATVSFGPETLELWPYTGSGFPGEAKDPVNLIFIGNTDPRDIRAALLSLDGDRSAFGFPAEAPFNSTWDDAVGDEQSGYSTVEGWTGSTIQLGCGNYQVARFHIRLFKMGSWTAGAAHFEVLIPGTADHQVISWEVAEQFLIVDFMRSGLLDADVPMMPTAQINSSPWRTIPAIIYNGLPVELRGLIGGPLGDVSEDVPIGSDGAATILNLAGKAPRVPGTRNQDLIIQYDQTVPKPFCSSGEYDYVYVSGPVTIHQTATLTESGTFEREMMADGELSITPINPMTGQPTGEPVKALVREHHKAYMDNWYASAASQLFQKLLPASADDAGRLFVLFQVNSDGHNFSLRDEQCASEVM